MKFCASGYVRWGRSIKIRWAMIAPKVQGWWIWHQGTSHVKKIILNHLKQRLERKQQCLGGWQPWWSSPGSLDALGAECCALPPLRCFSCRQVRGMGPQSTQDKPVSVQWGFHVSGCRERQGTEVSLCYVTLFPEWGSCCWSRKEVDSREGKLTVMAVVL